MKSQLGTAEMTYADANAADFVTELKAIDALDETAATGAADAGEQLTISLTDDEAAFEQALAPASKTFDTDVGQAQHDYRQAVALADYNLAVETAAYDQIVGQGSPDPAAQADYATAIAAAKVAEQDDYDTAYLDFATPMVPAIAAQGLSDAAAQLLDTDTTDDENLTDIVQNNVAVDAYQNEESAAYDGEQTADALALYSEQVSNAVGHASAIAAYAASDPNPWSDDAWSQAVSDMALKIAQATAELTQTQSQAGAQSTDEESQNDASEVEDSAYISV